MLTASESIDLANERMTIMQACTSIGLSLPDQMAVSPKLYCPFGDLYHADGGTSKAFRIYPQTNSAYCFAGCGAFRPVSLIALANDITHEQAASRILDDTNYVPPDYQAQWDALVSQTVSIDTDSLAEALQTYCRSISPDWEARQFDGPVAEKLARCLGLLRKVKTNEDVSIWMTAAKQAMRLELGEKSE